MTLSPLSMRCATLQPSQLGLTQARGQVGLPFESCVACGAELGHTLTAGGYVMLWRGARSGGTPFAGTNCARTFLNQQRAKGVYVGSVLCYVSVTFLVLLYQLVGSLRAVSVTLRGLEVCVSAVFF